MHRILVVDDEPSMRELLGIMLRKEGYEVVAAQSRKEAAAALGRGPVAAVITDIKLPDGDGIEILRHVKAGSPETVVIVMTAYGSTQTAVAALKLGAHDYLTKPFDIEEMKIVIRGALERRDLEQENRLLKAEFRDRHGLGQIIGSSRPMAAVFDLVRSVAPTSSTVLITGESGTGKELVAKAIHAHSTREDAPFVSVNCAAFPETLLESELFGHMRGAFTDAHQTKKGLFEAANRGTLFLDEVGETPPSMQVKLLRALQAKKIRRVGATDEVDVDVRVIAATNTSPEALVREGRFREDLFYRLNVIPIRIPPLRERPEDLPLLVDHFLLAFGREMNRRPKAVSAEELRILAAHPWPGNVRELENVVERAVALGLSPAELIGPPVGVTGQGARSTPLPPGFSLDEHLQAAERELMLRALEQAGGDRSRASQILGISTRSLRYLIAKHQAVQPDNN